MADPENVANDTGGDVVVTDKELFDHAISDAPAPAPAPAPETPAPAPAEPQPQQPETVARDQQGRFAPKPPQQAATTQAPQQPQAAPQQPQRMPEDHRVPLRELLEERERRQRIEAEAHQMRQAWARLQQEQQEQQQKPQGPETIFDAPDEYLNHRVMNPLRQEGFNMMLQMKDGLSREFANSQFGEQTVNAALQDMMQIRQTPQGDFSFRQIMASGHPYGALVKWHQQARAQQAIGSDPNAWLQQKQQEWVKDPKAQAAVLQYLREQQQASNRPPNVSLPPSLSSMPASSGRIDDQGDMSNDSLYKFATK